MQSSWARPVFVVNRCVTQPEKLKSVYQAGNSCFFLVGLHRLRQTSAKGFDYVLVIWVLMCHHEIIQTSMVKIILVGSKVWGKQLHGGVENLCSKQEITVLAVCSFFWQVFEATSVTYLPLLSLLIVTEWRLWTCTSVLVTMMRAEWKLCNTSHFEYTELTNVEGCPKVKSNITKFTLCDSSNKSKKEKKSSWLMCVIKCYRVVLYGTG